MRIFVPSCLALAFVPVAAFGQELYRPPSDTVYLLIVNPYRMYWVRGADTLSQPTRAVSLEAQRWNRDGQKLRVAVRQLRLDVHRTVKVDTFAVSPFGAVQTINGHAPGLNERVDLLPRLPGRSLGRNVTWNDTLQFLQAGPRGDHSYFVTRTWGVERLFDSAGARLAEISGRGVVRYEDSWWVDSAAGTVATIDVSGPVTERFIFSASEGQLIERSWSMNLTGRGMLPSDRGVDTTAAGLISSETERMIGADRAKLLARPLPGADTSMSYNTGPILLHTVARRPTEIEAAMTRNDGLVGTARARFSAGKVESYDALWTDTAATPRRIMLSVVHDSLLIRDPSRADTVIPIPATSWGVADYAMNEFLVPVFLARSADDVSFPFAVYRPYARHWDTGIASVRRLGENFIASYRVGADTLDVTLLITGEGDLLLGENAGPTGAQRLPLEGSSRRARLERILQNLRQ